MLESYNFNNYKQYTIKDNFVNSQKREQLHSTLSKLGKSLRQMSYYNFMRYLIAFFTISNMSKLNKIYINFCLQVCILTYNFSLESQEKCSTSQYYAILERYFSLEPQNKSSTSMYFALLERSFSQMCQVLFLAAKKQL